MSHEKILVVEDSLDISTLLKFFFTSKGYEVLTASYGQEALDICRTDLPNLVLLDVGLPDIDGYEVGKALRANRRTRHIPIVFLTAYGERKNRLKGLGEVQAQYYMVKPFDMEELYAIVKNLLDEARRKNQLHPVTNVPTAELINEQLRSLLIAPNWAVALIRIAGFESFTQTYGSVVGEDVLRFVAPLLIEALETYGDSKDFMGHASIGSDFVLISSPPHIGAISEALIDRFDQGIALYYPYHDRQRGYFELSEGDGVRQMPFMSLSIVVLTNEDGPFSDIRQFAELAEERHQQAARERGEASFFARRL